jgi:hypothetical protein
MKNFTYSDLSEFNLPLIDDKELNDVKWFFVKFQGANMCSIYNTRKKENWIEGWALPKTSVIRQTLENIIFPFLGGEGNVTIIKTLPGEDLNDHIDAAAAEYGTIQYKFRWVLSGKLDTLYFIDKNYNKQFIPPINSYIINGAFPHGMINDGKDIKYTLCVGSPWKPNDIFYKNIKEIKQNYLEMPVLKKEWTDPRIEEDLENKYGVTYY